MPIEDFSDKRTKTTKKDRPERKKLPSCCEDRWYLRRVLDTPEKISLLYQVVENFGLAIWDLSHAAERILRLHNGMDRSHVVGWYRDKYGQIILTKSEDDPNLVRIWPPYNASYKVLAYCIDGGATELRQALFPGLKRSGERRGVLFFEFHSDDPAKADKE